MIAPIRSQESVSEKILYVAFELASRQWKLLRTAYLSSGLQKGKALVRPKR